ncbi:hypothetical protein QFC22_006449 [Naganishia vaughanmartiniae]|uniref:Uncharacterized protein n=1 Tax=Naganishia vaughanmartiniae TaxID=1424756 RepID=A0ACC2WJ65_9TREE|nr:hypothetical protein QFC22_006449 [Naganishia vaughanmartiniae]
MRSTLLSLLLTTLIVVAASFPLVKAGKGGPSFCQTVDKLKVTSPLTFIRPVPFVNLKWNPKICLCQSDGELTDKTVAQLEAKIKQEGTKKLASKLGLDTLPEYWEELFVRQAVINAAENFLDQYKSCPRGCEYPDHAIPNSCTDCGYDCPKGQQKCNKKCKPTNKPCPSKEPKPPKPPKTSSTTDGYPTYPTYPVGYGKRDIIASDAAVPRPTGTVDPSAKFVTGEWKGEAFTLIPPTPAEAYLEIAEPAYFADSAYDDDDDDEEDSDDSDDVAKGAFVRAFVVHPTPPTTTFAVSDIPEPTMIQQYYRSSNSAKCEPGWIPCAVHRKGMVDWECTDVMNSLDSCGGCIFPILPGSVGTVCSEMTGVNEVRPSSRPLHCLLFSSD